jgi:hypothetical protein
MVLNAVEFVRRSSRQRVPSSLFFLRMRPREALVFLFAEQTFIALVFKFDSISPAVSSQRACYPEASQLVRASEYLRAVIVVSLIYRLCCSFGSVVRRLSSKTVSRRRDYRQSLFLSSSPLDPGLCEPGVTSYRLRPHLSSSRAHVLTRAPILRHDNGKGADCGRGTRECQW